MKKILMKALTVLTLAAMSTNLTAGTITAGNLIRVNSGDKFEDAYEAPKLYVKLEDAYTRAGETEIFKIKLKDAVWIDGSCTSIDLRDLEEVLPDECSISIEDEYTARVTVDIPSDVQKGTNVGFTVPLRIQVIGSSPMASIEKTSDTHLVDEQEFAIGVGQDKKATWKVGELTSYDQSEEIKMAPITFEEVTTGAISEAEFQVELNLENTHYKFDINDYKELAEHADDKEYTLSGSQYLTYEGGFSGTTQDFNLITYPDNPRKILLKLKGCVPSSQGRITLHDFPITRVVNDHQEEDITISIKGDAIVAPSEKVVVAYSIYRENPVNGPKPQEIQADEKKVTTPIAGIKDIKETKGQANQDRVIFTVNEPYYLVNEVKNEMNAAPYIEQGYMMVPVRYVALAFGAKEADITGEGNQIHLSVFNKQITLEKESKIAIVDGKRIEMAQPIKIVQGRVYAPIGEISKLLGVEKAWNQGNQSAEFTKINDNI